MNHLTVAMLNVGLWICSTYDVKHYLRFGETNGSILETAPKQELSKELKLYLETFVDEIENRWELREPLKYPRAVVQVLSGEASSSSMVEMRLALAAALHSQSTVRGQVSHVAGPAFGAAQRGLSDSGVSQAARSRICIQLTRRTETMTS
ncbi:hypothetical protein ACMFMG_001800 [Clarireedia jacksonii]